MKLINNKDFSSLVHLYQMGGVNIAVDVNSGAVHILDDTAFAICEDSYNMDLDEIKRKYDNYSIEEIEGAYNALMELKDNAQLYSSDSYLANTSADFSSHVIKAMCLNVAHDCNLRCRYCFASEGNYGKDSELMDFETGKKALDYLMANSGTRKNLEVDFFGGEPLMNFDVVKQLVAYGDETGPKNGKHFRWTITTNGVLLDDEIIDYINEHMDNAVLSLDGRKEINDKNRPSANGKGSYDIVVPKFKKLVDKRDKNKDHYIRGTFTKDNLDFSKDILHFRDLGFNITSIEPVVDANYNPYAIKSEYLDKIEQEYEKLALEIVSDEDFSMFHFEVDLSQGPCVIKRVRGCGAGSEYLAIAPNGDIYPCHQFVGNDAYLMGNIHEEKISLPDDMQRNFKSANIFTKPKCQNCWAKYYCSGGCHANALNFNNDILEPYEEGCRMQRKRLECAIMMSARRALNKIHQENTQSKEAV